MQQLRSFFLGLFGIALSILTSILVMTHGWGLEPKSYTWIIVIAFLGQLAALTIIELAKGKD